MRDMRAQSEKLHKEAAECEMTSKLATDSAKRDLFVKLAAHYSVLAREVDRAIKQQQAS